jgi:uncharacterized protein YneF (UPF0154 family)
MSLILAVILVGVVAFIGGVFCGKNWFAKKVTK